MGPEIVAAIEKPLQVLPLTVIERPPGQTNPWATWARLRADQLDRPRTGKPPSRERQLQRGPSTGQQPGVWIAQVQFTATLADGMDPHGGLWPLATPAGAGLAQAGPLLEREPRGGVQTLAIPADSNRGQQEQAVNPSPNQGHLQGAPGSWS